MTMNMSFKKRYSSVQKVKLSLADWQQQCEDMYNSNLKAQNQLGKNYCENYGNTN